MRRLQAAGGTALNGPTDPAQEAPRRLGILLAIAGAVYLADVISKAIVVAILPPPHQVRLLGGLLKLTVLRNSGAAFSIGTSMTVVFTLIAVGVIVFILRTSRRLRSLPWAVTLGLLLGGATGNLTDRIFRAPGIFRGDVVDWIQLPHWPVFNLADSSIVCGGVLAVLLAARGIRLDGTREGQPHPGQGGGLPPDAGAGGAAPGPDQAGVPDGGSAEQESQPGPDAERSQTDRPRAGDSRA